jgi:LysM repeat protein
MMLAAAAVVCICSVTTACTAGQAHRAAEHSAAVSRSVATPVAAPIPTPVPTFTPDPYWVTPLGQVYSQDNPVDLGPRRYAEGTTTKNAQGVPVSYVVASGDVFTVIAARLQMQIEDLLFMNCLRRNDLTSWTLIYPGDILNLDPHTALSVGTQDGGVYTPTPAQRTMCLNGLPPQH